MRAVPSCSVVMYTYNWPHALETALFSVFQQSVQPKEIVICDDGSSETTRKVVDQLRAISPVPLFHVWHADQGFRKAIILNKGVAVTTGEYIIAVDQDVILHKHFIKDHLNNCKSGLFLTSNRLGLDAATTKETLDSRNYRKPFLSQLPKKGLGALRLPGAHKLLATSPQWHKIAKHIIGCNMSFWRNDFIRLNGYDETYEGWENLDLALRLINSGVKLSFIHFAAIQFHLYQVAESRKQQLTLQLKEMMAARERSASVEKGVQQYLPSFNLRYECAPATWHVGNELKRVSA